MDNEILGYVIVKLDTIKTSLLGNNKNAFGEIKFKKVNNNYVEPDKEEFGEYLEAFIAANNTDFESYKYYLCAYYENTKKDVRQKIYINDYIKEIKPVEIVEDEEIYLERRNVYWNDTKITYKPIEQCSDEYCIEGWSNSTIYKYLDNTNMIIMPSEKPDKYKDYLLENKNENELNRWFVEEIKTYNQNIQKEVEQIIVNKINDGIYSERWRKGLEQFKSSLLIKNDDRKDELIKVIDTFYHKKSEEVDKEIAEKIDSIKDKETTKNLLEDEIKLKQEEKDKLEHSIKKLQSIKIDLKNEVSRKEEEINILLEDVNKVKEKLEKENAGLRQQNIELKANLEHQQIEYSLKQKEDLIKISIDVREYGIEYKKETENKIIVKKYDNLKNVIDELDYTKHERIIIYPNPKWVLYDDLWCSGFGTMFEMAHKNPDKLYVVIIQNYNLSPCECWSMPVINLIKEYTDKLLYSKYTGYPHNLWLYFIESKVEEISFPVSEYFNSIFNGINDE